MISLLLPLALLASGCGSTEASPTTARVVRDSVTSTVTATGTLQSVTEQNVGFPQGGELVALEVSVGQRVEAGQVLARTDDFEARVQLRQARALLAREQAALDRILDGNQVDAAADDLDRARSVFEAIKEQAEAVDGANDEAVQQAERQLDFEQSNLRREKRRLDSADDRCDDSPGGDADDDDGGLLSGSALRPRSSPSCDRERESRAAVAAAERQVVAAEAAFEQAIEQRRVDDAQQQVAVENARRDVAAAENEAEGAGNDRPHDIDEQCAVVADAQAEVDLAQAAVDDTILRAPVAGTVASVNGVVGEFVDGAAGTTPLAPGGRTPLPGVSSGISSSPDAAGGDAERPGGPAFIVLTDVNSFQVVAPFEESDAAKVEPNQSVEVSFDAIPDLTRSGTVSAIAPTATSINDVVNYYATVVLNELDPRLADGQTAEVNVIVAGRDNVLVVPSAAVRRAGDTGVVSVLQPDGTVRQVQVRLGLVGDSVTQVLSGLREGQEVVIAQAG